MFSRDLAVDLGTSNLVIFQKGRGIVVREPSVVALLKATGEPKAFGTAALEMMGRSSSAIEIVRPIRDGVLANYTATEAMLRYYFGRLNGRLNFTRPRVIVSAPCDVTSVERQAVLDVCRAAGAREAWVLEEPMAAALGLGLGVGEASGQLVVDIGGGTTDIAVIALGGTIVADTVRVGGDKFDEAIHRTVRRANNILLGERSAEEIKIAIGSAFPLSPEVTFEVRGRDLNNGMPKSANVSSVELRSALVDPIAQIVARVRMVLEQTPPELANDIVTNGLWLTGGSAHLRGLNKKLARETGLEIHVAEDPLSCVANGLGRALEQIDALAENQMAYSSSLSSSATVVASA